MNFIKFEATGLEGSQTQQAEGSAAKPLPTSCTICGNDVRLSPDFIVLCEHKNGVVHSGCCAAHCSLDGQGHLSCRHAKHAFEKCEITIEEK